MPVLRVFCVFTLITVTSGYFFGGGTADDVKIFSYNQYLRHSYTDTSRSDSKSKVETLGAVLKRHIQNLKHTYNKQVDIIFLVDSSTSVGKHNFIDEIKFVKQLLSDFTVDTDHTQVSVITFSSRERVIRQIDYLDEKGKDRHKCSLLEDDLRKITYSGGGTYTLGAFLEARKVLQNARQNASKAIFLVTDGFSNGGDPRPEAEALRREGVKVYTFGIQNGNVRELYDMASEPKNESCYILDSFEEFEALARRALHEDLSVGKYIKQPNRKCNRLCVGKHCCDPQASCCCGIHTGKYECVCPEGYYGNGLKGGCQECPPGTYKPDVKPGDVYTCTRCPDEHHTSLPGSVSVDQCVCSKGFRALNSTRCAVLKCPQLEAPKNGYFVNDKCKSVFNAACGLRCKPGYELQGSGLRICREDGIWSGIDTHCIMKTCPALMKPKNGNMICTTDDFTFNTVCRFTCDTGYKLVGSRKRTCLAIAFWTGINTRCREITCQPLSQIRDGGVHPRSCIAGEVAFGTTCSITCLSGYTLIGPHSRQCLPEGLWTPAAEPSQCVDTAPPFIMCPYDVDTVTDPNENTATVQWEVPLAVDNSGYVPILTSVPAVIPPSEFPMGTTKVTYIAEDLNKNKADCFFLIKVMDKQKPTVDKCYSPAPVVSSEPYIHVNWEEPIFSDNSGVSVFVRRSHAPGLFPIGKTTVTYTAYDQSGNNNTCEIIINVIPHPCEYPRVPLNGNRTCYEDEEGVVCQFFCQDGYSFAIEPATQYTCAFDNKWEPVDRLPVSDCTAIHLSNDIIQPASFTFAGLIACQQRPVLTRLEKDFEHRVTKRVNELCEEGISCSIQDLETTCEQSEDFNKVRVTLGRSKRSTSLRETSRPFRVKRSKITETEKIEGAIVTFAYNLESSIMKSGSAAVDRTKQKQLQTTVNNIVTTLRKDAKRGDLNLEADGKIMELTDMSFDEDPVFVCKPGSVLKGQSCVACPEGTYFNVISEVCVSCDIGTYQQQTGQLTCLVCPVNMTTLDIQATNKSQCRALCLPGTVSPNGLEICETCEKGFHQEEYGQRKCKQCPERFTTKRRGARELSDCKEKCPIGYASMSGFVPCFPCPLGTYQPNEGKSSCFECPYGADTFSSGSTNITDCEFVQSDSPQNQEPYGLFEGGQQTELLIDQCFDEKCLNGATCRSDVVGFECICAPGYTGVFCQDEIDECADNPCQHGICVDVVADYTCLCEPGWTGKKCEVNIDDCADQPCQNGATCIDGIQKYSCNCENGFEGEKCEINIDDCASGPCLNGGSCTDGVAAYTCQCPEGIEGNNCEINQDDCVSGPCQNEGSCVDEIGGYRCECTVGFEGQQCEMDIDECADNPCPATARCEDLPGGYQCHCPTGFTGENCSEEIDIYFQLDFPSTATTTDYAHVTMGQDLTAATVCFWMKSDDTQNQGTPFSYATTEGDNILTLTDYDGKSNLRAIATILGPDQPVDICNLIYICTGRTTVTKAFKKLLMNCRHWYPIGVDTVIVIYPFDRYSKVSGHSRAYTSNKRSSLGSYAPVVSVWFVLYVNGEKVTTTVQANDGMWHHICVIWSSSRGSWKIYMDGNLQDSGRNLGSGQTVRGGGQFVIGQEQDSLGGGFSSPETFIGKLTQLNVWSQELSLSAIENLRLSCEKSLGDVIAWTDISSGLRGAVTDSPVDFCKDCPIPANIEYGTIEYTGVTAGSVATYTCTRGFNVAGRSQRQCLVTGEWEGTEPTCTRVQCGFPGRIEHGWIEGQRFTFDNRIRYFCDSGYNLVGDSTRYCDEDGQWEGAVPTCEQIMCSIPELSENTRIVNPKPNNRYLPGEDAFFECTEGHRIYGDHTSVYCQRDGTWDHSIPSCDPQTCGLPPVISHGQLRNPENLVEFSVGYTVEYECEFGFEIDPTGANPGGRLSCLPTGLWEDNLPVCRTAVCPEPPTILNGRYEADGFEFLDQVRYECNRGYELRGDDVIECLETKIWSPDPPQCLAVRCGQPDDILYGSVSFDKDTYEGVARYECNLGYVLMGEAERRCLENASWSGTVPVCKPISCGRPDAIEHGQVIGRDFTLNNFVTYTCDEGYRLVGSSERVCRETGKWQNEAPTCTRVECEYPFEIDHGFFLETSFFYQDTVNYECDDGYRLEGISAITCQSNSAWSSAQPSCVEIVCSMPPGIEHGSPLNPQALEVFSIGHLIQYQCETGYEFSLNSLNSLGQIRCLGIGQWEANLPVCQLIECPAPQKTDNGQLEVSALTYQSIATYTCDEGYAIEGSARLVCESNKNWSSEAPVCNSIVCDAPDAILHGDVDYKDLKLGSVVRYACDDGYTLVGIEVRRCLANLSYSGEKPTCEPVECREPEDIENGFRTYTGTTFQSTVTYSCNTGYILIGDTLRTCQGDKSWSGQAPMCEIVQCDKPSRIISNGRMIGDIFTYNSVIEYVCDSGYLIDGLSNRRTCQANGRWDSPIPVCTAVECPRLTLPNGFVSGFQTEYGTTHRLSCKPGYRLEGTAERTCLQSGLWSGEETVCIRYACPRLNPPTNGQVLVRGLQATYQCLAGFELHGVSERECLANDTWSHSDPSCNPIPCPDITGTEFPNGLLTYDQLTYGSSIVYECVPGYLLVGIRRLDCLIDGSWSGDIPVCEKIRCAEPHKNVNSRVIGEDFSFNSSIQYVCEEGYELFGQDTRVCQSGGFWTGIAPTCSVIHCPPPTPASFMKVSESDNTYSSVVEYSCDPGYELVGNQRRTCLASGFWSGSEPSCLRIECPEPLPLEHGNIFGDIYTAGSRITYKCNEGYKLKGLNLRLCLGTKKWTGDDPACVKKKCPRPPPLANGYFSGLDWSYQDIVEYRCEQGYEIKGKTERQCQSSGEWSEAETSCIKVSCGTPVLPQNVLHKLPEDTETGQYQVRATLVCEEGYQGVGSSEIYCQANGAWSETNFHCEIVTCPEFRTLPNGRVIGDSFEYDQELQIQCDQGYTLIGQGRFHCLATGRWGFGQEPRCELVTCPELPPPSNGIIHKTEENNIYLSEVTYSCDQGYKLSGTSKRVCQKDGTWSGEEGICQLIVCDEPPTVQNALLLDPATRYLFASEARYVCNTGYYISSGYAVLTCSSSGDWEGQVPTCAKMVCGKPSAIQFGKATFTSDDFDSTATYVCNNGYRLRGSAIVRCGAAGTWSGSLPSCVPVNCGVPPPVDNSITIDAEEPTFNSIMTYICNEGYRLIGQQSSTCQATGVWSGEPPECQPISCGPPPTVDHAMQTGDGQFYKNSVTYTCEDGYEMSGEPTLECHSSGLWTYPPPHCEQISCDNPPVIPHSSTTMSMGPNFGSTAEFLCNEGYYLVGSSSAMCTADKRWEYEEAPSCEPVECDPLQEIPHASVVAKGTTYNSLAEYVCDIGYQLAGVATLRCDSRGEWKGEIPSCQPLDCGLLPQISHGTLILNQTTYDSIAEYVCEPGYTMTGTAIQRCGSNGSWNGQVPTCDPISCGEPVVSDHVFQIGSSYSYQSVVDFDCKLGYRLVGQSSIICQEDGRWSSASPQCLRISCGPLLLPENGLVVLGDPVTDTFYNDTVKLGCDEGYTLEGESQLRCLETGKWSSDIPQCTPPLAALLTCPEDTRVAHSRPLLVAQPVGSSIEVECEVGYEATGSLTASCQEDRSWSVPDGQCQRIFCGKPVLRDFVNVVGISGTSYYYGDKIQFTCRKGVQPARMPPFITCREGGRWDGEISCGVTCKQPCLNGGVCLGLNRCKCPTGFAGRRCETAICILPCLNGGKCVKPYQCSCPVGFTGVRCNEAICDQPCQHGGKCLKPNKCWCPNGYTGAFCQTSNYSLIW